MKIEVTREGTSLTIALEGKIDENGADELKAAFTNVKLDGVEDVKVDFRYVSYIGSSGIGKLLLFYKNLGVKHIKLMATGVSASTYELFKELKLDTIFLVEKL